MSLALFDCAYRYIRHTELRLINDLPLEYVKAMITDTLGPLQPQRKTGMEKFHRAGVSEDFDLLDFWQWSMSDLVNNTKRGILAEYIVAKALGISTAGVRREWIAYDLEMQNGTRIEVKSAAYIQSWAQSRLSSVQFVVRKRLGWDGESNISDPVPRRYADLYVFALLAHKDKPTIDPLDLTQWCFWVVPTKFLDERKRSQHSITVASLYRLIGDPVDYWNLASQVASVLASVERSTDL
jgi:hypothetical protein